MQLVVTFLSVGWVDHYNKKMNAKDKQINAKQKRVTKEKETIQFDLQDELDCDKGYVDVLDTTYKVVRSCKDDDTSYENVGSCKDDDTSYENEGTGNDDSTSCRECEIIYPKSPMWPIKLVKTDDN